MRYAAIALIGVMILAAGCAAPYTFGKQIDQGKMNQIVLGKTNTDQLVSILGKPNKIEPVKAGVENYVYYYYQDKPTHWYKLNDAEEQRLIVTLASGTVQRINLVQQGIDEVNK